MPAAVPERLPSTPAEVAAAVLDNIKQYPSAFDMNEWANLADSPRLPADQAPECGTTLCAAGWVVHVTGWTVVDLPPGQAEDVLTTDHKGREFLEPVTVYAEKHGEKRLIWDVAREALGLNEEQTFWYASDETALARLAEIAGRLQNAAEPDMDAGTGHGAYEHR